MRHASVVASAAGLAVVVIAGSANAQVASAQIREDGAAPAGLPAGYIVGSISNPAQNRVGGWGFGFNGEDPAAIGPTISAFFGNAAGGAGALLRQEGTFAGFEQTSFESFWGLGDAGVINYSPSVTRLSDGTTGLDGVWSDSTPVAVEEDPSVSEPGRFVSFGSRPNSLADGTPVWVGGLTDTQGGGTQDRYLYLGTESNPVLGSGSVIAGQGTISAGSGIDFDFRFSGDGSNYLTPVDIAEGSSTDDGLLVQNGNALFINGGVVREASPNMANGALPGENWDNFDFMGVSNAGDTWFTGDTDAATSEDEFVAMNNDIILREGASISTPSGNATISGSIEGGYMNDSGDWAVIWDVDVASGDNLEALIVNGVGILLEGDSVDWNGDGVIDAGEQSNAIANFTGISALTVGERAADGTFQVAFTADIDFDGTSTSSDDLEGGFLITVPAPGTLALLGLGGLAIRRRR